jgi:hypothetical protein
MSCKDGRYSQNSSEIEVIKAMLNDYDYQNWDALVMHYADSAQIFHNSRIIILTPDDLPDYYQNNDVSFTTRAFEDESREYEMITDDQGQRWVNFWGLWKGHLAINNKELVVPVHITAKFIDGKIVREYGYWDHSILMQELRNAIENQSIEEEEEEEEEASLEQQ